MSWSQHHYGTRHGQNRAKYPGHFCRQETRHKHGTVWSILCYKRAMPVVTRGRYLGRFPTTVEVNGRKLEVTAHFAAVGGRMTCVGLDVRSFWAPVGFEPPDDKESILPVGEEWVEITSPLVRGVKTAEVIDTAFKQGVAATAVALDRIADSLDEAGASSTASPEELERVRTQVERLLSKEAPRRRGPKPLLGDDVLRDVVAKTYMGAPRKPVQAVREALAAAVPAYKGEVSPDVARKAVATARARGFIPPASSGSRRQKEQP